MEMPPAVQPEAHSSSKHARGMTCAAHLQPDNGLPHMPEASQSNDEAGAGLHSICFAHARQGSLQLCRPAGGRPGARNVRLPCAANLLSMNSKEARSALVEVV